MIDALFIAPIVLFALVIPYIAFQFGRSSKPAVGGEEEDSPVFVSEGDFMAPSKKYFHDMTGGAVGLSVIGGDIYLLMPDMKMHKLEVTKYVKPSATGEKPAAVRSIRKNPEP